MVGVATSINAPPHRIASRHERISVLKIQSMKSRDALKIQSMRFIDSKKPSIDETGGSSRRRRVARHRRDLASLAHRTKRPPITERRA
jgi:hypothetical protein